MSNFIQLIESIGFSPKSGQTNVWAKCYNGYEITIKYDCICPQNSIIDYGTKIKTGRKTTCNFHQTESFVVLECVNRLLEKGYKPESIELEKTWNLGHNGKGFLDILVKDLHGMAFLMIECKVWGKDFETEIKNTLNKSKNGSQIFSYLQQEPKTTEAICLYTYNPDTQEYKTSIVYNHKDWADLNQEDRYNRWLGKFEDNGIFESWVKPYNLQFKALTKMDLKPLNKVDGDNIYNKFAEILRHNVISDKSNAFNKIINLFLCKIYDEDTNDDEELKFQTRSGTNEKSDEDLLLDLSDLYMNGMKYYLNKDIEDITLQDFQSIANRANNQELIDAYRQLRLYKDNVFGFREVFDKQSFKDNAKVVREIVELLQDKQLRYSHKQQFLGDFFESLLKDSIKQESGQFFTPVPITQFIINSIPLREIIYDNIQNKKDDILPYTIDYAMGSGHFLTEVMDEYNKIIKTVDTSKIAKTSLKKEVESWQINDFAWAEKYVYGIDLDYRLVKTTKIACFLNGDGLANIIHADGLDSFSKSTVYKDKLKSLKNTKDNEQFDVLISNPPYAVRAFKNTLNDGINSFDLYKDLTDNSSEIECLFIERAKQLVRENGIVAIVLPISVLTNNGIYEKAREILLKNFEFKAIVALGGQAFAATNTKTVILFMRKRASFVFEEIKSATEKFFETYEDVSINGIKNCVSLYINSVWDSLKFEDYVNFLKNNKSTCDMNSDFCKEYKDIPVSEVIEIEKEKLTYFALTYTQKIVLADSKDKDTEKAFYGYEFSNRRGHEGIQIYRDADNNIKTKLFDCLNKYNGCKLNTYILNNFQNVNVAKEVVSIKNNPDHSLHEHIDYLNLSDLISFDTVQFNKSLNLNAKKKIEFDTTYPLEQLGNLLETIQTGSRNSKIGQERQKTGIPSLGGEHIGLDGKVVFSNMRYITEDEFDRMSHGIIKPNDILLCKDGALTGKVALLDSGYPYSKSSVNEHVFILRAKTNKILQEYLFAFLYSDYGQNMMKSVVSGAAQGGLSKTNILKIKIPVLPKKDQENIIEKLHILYDKQSSLLLKKKKLLQEEFDIFKSFTSTDKKRLGDIISLEYGVPLPKQKRNDGEYPVVGANGIIGYHDKYLIKGPSIIVGRKGSVGKVNKISMNNTPIDTTYYVNIKNNSVLIDYVYFVLKRLNLESLNKGLGSGGLNRNDAYALQIDLHNLSDQNKIIDLISPLEQEIDSISKEQESIRDSVTEILNIYFK